MSKHENSSTPTSMPAPAQGRGLILFGAISVALISTAAAYVAMTGFGRDVLKMGSGNAYAFAGVFELSLITVALMAREAAQQNRPAQTLLTLTWGLSGASGTFAAAHELYLGHGPVAAAFRFTVPLLAALMWHLALIGDRHLAMERSWSELRAGARMHAMIQARVERQRAALAAETDRSRRARRRLERANKHWEKVEAIALSTVPPAEMRKRTAEWTESFEAVRGTRAPADLFASERPELDVASVAAVTASSAMSDKALTGRTDTGDTSEPLAIAGGDNHRAVTPVTPGGDDTERGDTTGGDTAPVTPRLAPAALTPVTPASPSRSPGVTTTPPPGATRRVTWCLVSPLSGVSSRR